MHTAIRQFAHHIKPSAVKLPSSVAAIVLKLVEAFTMDALVPDGFCDPITMELMCDPVIIEGISFERSSAESWLRDHDTHPSTGVRLVSKVYLIFDYVSLMSNRSFLHSSQVLTPNFQSASGN